MEAFIIRRPTILYSRVYILLCAFQLICSTLSSSSSPHESFALLQFKGYFSTTGSSSNYYCDEYGGVASFPKTDSWKEGTDCCLWDGVTCDGLTGYVTELDLSCGRLSGELPSINTTFFLLPQLQRLNLAFNNFSGIPISSDFGQLVHLTYLNLSSSDFGGIVPHEISHLLELVSLDLSKNFFLSFDGSSFEMVSKNLTKLQHLLLDNVDISSVELPNSFLNLSSSLVSLSLSNCELQGEFPTNFFRLPHLKRLTASGNEDLEITLPKSNWSSTLEMLDLSESIIYGGLPYSIRNLTSLHEFLLPNCGVEGLIPDVFENLTKLTALDLSGNNLNGQLPLSIFNSPLLSKLSFGSNQLIGQLPSTIRGNSLPKLIRLALLSNRLNGTLPSWLFNLPSLQRLYLNGNQFTGQILEFQLENLTSIDLSFNKIDGTIPPWLFSISSLEHIDLSNNQFIGEIPEFQSKSFMSIYLDNNMLYGEVPKSVFKLANLTHLSLASNNFFGILEFDMLSELKNLQQLDLSHTNLSIHMLRNNNMNSSTWLKLSSLGMSSCNLSEFPNFLRTQHDLKSLDLSKNSIGGTIPKWMSNIGKDTLQYLNLSHNYLSGTVELPWKILDTLDLRFNMLQGPLPIHLPLEMSFFSISNNFLSEEVSPSICNLTSLRVLDLLQNNLSGAIPPCLGNFSEYLFVLDLRMNRFQGIMPTSFAEGCDLHNLNLQGNQLEGLVSNSLQNCTKLEVVNVGNNMFDDTFPLWLETLPELKVVVLRSNKFYGSIPEFKDNDSFSKLLLFDLSNNYFSGSLPALENFKAMVNADDSNYNSTSNKYLGANKNLIGTSYDYTVTVTLKGDERVMEKIFYTFTSIDLSNNNFEGVIPEYIGDLHSLRSLNLSHNRLSGHIPPSMGNLSVLESLDISSNKFSGEIPRQLVDMISLGTLNLSQNQLVGRIPEGNQFNTFTSDSYRGNLGLCGLPLRERCGDEKPQLPGESVQQEEGNPTIFENGFGWQAIGMGYGCGLLFGLAMGYVMFRIGKLEWMLGMIMRMKGYGRTGRTKRPGGKRHGRRY